MRLFVSNPLMSFRSLPFDATMRALKTCLQLSLADSSPNSHVVLLGAVKSHLR